MIYPKRPYLLKAYYDWLVDNDFTPYLVVDATYFGVNVPIEFVKDGQIVLNLSMNATANLQMNKDSIEFMARFSGVPRNIYIPMGAAVAIYARENGDGVMFEPEACYDSMNQMSVEQPQGFENIVDKPKTTELVQDKPKKSASHLRIVK